MKAVFDVVGGGFDQIPQDAIAILADRNTAPTEYKDSTLSAWSANLTIISPFEMEVTQAQAHTHSANFYLGAIVSADRQTIYWVNETQPLP